MNQTQHTASTQPEDRVRRLRELLAMMVDRYGDASPMVARLRRNLAEAEAARAVAQDGRVAR